jgi:hypothetical protein
MMNFRRKEIKAEKDSTNEASVFAFILCERDAKINNLALNGKVCW